MAQIVQNASLTPEAIAKLSKDEKDWVYNALDCCVTYEVHDRQLEAIDDVTAATAAFSYSLMAPILEMNMRGTLIDETAKQSALRFLRGEYKRIEAVFLRLIHEGIGLPAPFNYRSDKQLKWLFYSVLDLKPVKARNSRGIWAPTVNREALEKLQQYWQAQPLCLHVLALRDIDKQVQFLTTEIDSDQRIRTSFNIGGTNTGRLASSASDMGTGTNQQNVARHLRKVYIPDTGWKFCNVDLEQGDSRGVGAICWELFVDTYGERWAGAYLDACESGDLHTTVARMSWPELGWTGDRKVDRGIADQLFYRSLTYRDSSKRLGHGTNYLGQPPQMAQQTKIERKIVETFQQRYFAGFPCLPEWHKWVIGRIHSVGYLTTHFYNRRRHFFGRPEDGRTQREAVAYEPQSLTADAIDTGLLNLWRWGRIQCLIQVHDSILFQYRAEEEEEIIPKALDLVTIRHRLKKGREFFVPAEAKVGWNWGDVEFNKKGEVVGNEEGLLKWKGVPDLRPRPLRATDLASMLEMTI